MSKAEKLRGRLASIQRDREEFERQKKELEADMNVGRNNMSKINKGLRNNAILQEPIVVDSHIGNGGGAHASTPHHHSTRATSERSAHISTREYGSSANGSNSVTTPSGGASGNFATTPGSSTPTPGNMFVGPNGMGSPTITSIMPSGPRISDWCYSAPLDSPAPPTVKSREMYENVRLLGRGSFGEVNLVKNVEDNKLFAIKTQLCPKESEFQNVLREVRFLRACRHPCIIDVHDAFLMTNPRIVYIVMHYCEAGTISGVISSAKKNKSTLAENQILKWVLQLALAMQFLHDNHVVHRDLKPMNVMLTEGGDSLKLADFGLAMSMTDVAQEDATDEAGTPYYTAPEMISREPYSYPADCWSFGVIVHQLLALERPFEGGSTAELVKAILSADLPPLPAHYSDDIKLISAELLRRDQNERLTMTDLLLEPIFQSKLTSFPQSYRPRALEERIRRSHQKQLEGQIDTLNRSRRAEGFRTLQERVAARQQAAAEAAAVAQAAAAALAATDASGGSGSGSVLSERGSVSSPNGPSSVTPRGPGRSGSINSARNSSRQFNTSASGIRLSNADSTAAQASAAVDAVQSLEVSVPPSPSSATTPERAERSPTDVAERTRSRQKSQEVTKISIPEETAQDVAQSAKVTTTAPGTSDAEALASPAETSATAAAAAAGDVTVDSAAAALEAVTIAAAEAQAEADVPQDGPSSLTEPAGGRSDKRIESLVDGQSYQQPAPTAPATAPDAPLSVDVAEPAPPAQLQPEREQSVSLLSQKSSSIETIPYSPVKNSLSGRELSNVRTNSGELTPHGGRKGLELARAKETDVFYESQLGVMTQELVTEDTGTLPISPNSKSQSFAGDVIVTLDSDSAVVAVGTTEEAGAEA